MSSERVVQSGNMALRDSDLADPFRHRRTQLSLLQHRHDLFLRKALSLRILRFRWLILPETNPQCVSEIGEPLIGSLIEYVQRGANRRDGFPRHEKNSALSQQT